MKNIGEYINFRKDVCKITEMKENPFNHVLSYTLIPVKDASLKLNVPVDNTHIRDVMTKKEIETMIKNIPNIPVIDVEDKLLENEYKKLLSEETNENLIRIIKTTYLRNQKRLLDNKKISDKDNRYFEMAETYLYNEIAISLNMTFEEAKEYVIHKLKKMENKD